MEPQALMSRFTVRDHKTGEVTHYEVGSLFDELKVEATEQRLRIEAEALKPRLILVASWVGNFLEQFAKLFREVHIYMGDDFFLGEWWGLRIVACPSLDATGERVRVV